MGCAQTSQHKVTPETPPLMTGKTLLTSKRPDNQPMDKKPSLSIEVPPAPPTDTYVPAAQVSSSQAETLVTIAGHEAEKDGENPDASSQAVTPTATPVLIAEVREALAEESNLVTDDAQVDPKMTLESATSFVSPLPSPLSSPQPSRSCISAATTRSTFSFAEKGTRGKVRPSPDEMSLLEPIPDESGEGPLAAEKAIETAVHAMVDVGESLWGKVATAWSSHKAPPSSASEEDEDGEDDDEEVDEEKAWANPLERAHVAFTAACV